VAIFGLRQKNEIPIDIENLEDKGGNWPLHMIPGDVFEHLNFYLLYDADSVDSTVRYLEARYAELDGGRGQVVMRSPYDGKFKGAAYAAPLPNLE